ncbi:MAG: cupin domain-containing protein [Bacteroidales bacterium]
MKTNLKDAPNISTVLDVRLMYSGDKADLVHLTLKKDEKIAKHDNPIDVIFFVKEGNGKLTLNNDMLEITANDCIPVKTGIQRSMENISEADFKVLVFKIKYT